jgi:Mrp family chromosome partitioning ATPase
MTLDALDAAFLQRWQAMPVPIPAPAPAPEQASAALPPQPAAVSPPPLDPAPPPTRPVRPDAGAPLLERLLAEAWPQWNAIADRVEAARARGRRVIAVAGSERGEGRTTLVAGLSCVLATRGRDVQCAEPHDLAAADDAARTHDKRIVLVDAGIWFPPGPIRRQRLIVASLGCEAVIVVRRAGRPSLPAIEAAVEALGIEVLGEVVTFAPAEETPA